MNPGGSFPYCGAPAVPHDLLWRWNLDPLLLAALAAASALHWWLANKHDVRLFAAGWVLVALIFVSPFCALTSALFSGRSAHHMLLIAVVPPLLLLAAPRLIRPASVGALTLAALLHAATLWVWHAPAAYAAALADTRVYWLMQASLFGTAAWLWRGALAPGSPLGAASAMAFTFMQTALLGAVLALAPSPLYAFHLVTTAPWGLSPLTDQQLAGAAMWTLGGIPYLWAALRSTFRLVQPQTAHP